MLRYLTAGESHGEGLVAILEGMPSGIRIDEEFINKDLAERQKGYGRGKRMAIERDKVKLLSGIRKGKTIGSPIAIIIPNVDHSIEQLPEIWRPRPGHADLAGSIKYSQRIRNVLERASARETAARVAVGALTKLLLREFKINIISHVVALGGILADVTDLTFEKIKTKGAKSPLRCADKEAERLMKDAIDEARRSGDSLGGVFEVIIRNVPVGLGSYAHYDRKLDALLAQAVMSIQGIKAVEIGLGFGYSKKSGSAVHDEIFYKRGLGCFRVTNNAGGIEGGMSNGEPIIIRGCMKPIATLIKPLRSVNLKSKRSARAKVERADVCAVPAVGVVGETVCAFEIAAALCEKFGGDSLTEMKRNFDAYIKNIE